VVRGFVRHRAREGDKGNKGGKGNLCWALGKRVVYLVPALLYKNLRSDLVEEDFVDKVTAESRTGSS